VKSTFTLNVSARVLSLTKKTILPLLGLLLSVSLAFGMGSLSADDNYNSFKTWPDPEEINEMVGGDKEATVMSPGDIMFVYLITDGNGEGPVPDCNDCGVGFGFVALVDIDPAQTIYFTEEEVNVTENGFLAGGEGNDVVVSALSPDCIPDLTSPNGPDQLCGANTTPTFSVTATDLDGAGVAFVLFNSPQTGTNMYTGIPLVDLGTVPNGSIVNNTASLTATNFPSTPGTYYVYAILDPAPAAPDCRPFAQFVVEVLPGNCGNFPWAGSTSGVTPQTPQQRLDGGETPCDLLDDGVLIEDLYGLTYQGGLIFYVDNSGSPCSGLVAAPVDQGTGVSWGCQGTTIPGADGTAIGTGAQNTMDILNGCAVSGIAADLASQYMGGGYSDWFLPSRVELERMYTNLKQNNLGNLDDFPYWSSTEIGVNDAFDFDFFSGNQEEGSKDNPWNVRAVRAF
jgi:hypothetical protein